jgi:hypothetical protein
MLPLANTYTYTARSANDPRKVVTFTLHDDKMSVDVAALIEQVERAVAARGDGEEPEAGLDEAERTEQTPEARPWFTPGAASLLERATEAFHLSDVQADAPENGLHVTAWVRANNLRLAPVLFRMKEVDNPKAADDFVAEIERRKEEAPSAKRLPGPFDYWAGWALGGALAVGALAAWLLPRRDQEDKEEAPEDEIRVESE